jgi:hypothetical protein
MLVLVTFLTIGMAAVLLMLRFIFALDADIRAARRRSADAAQNFAAHRSFPGDKARALTLVGSASKRQAVRASALRNAYFQSGKQSESKGA